MLHNVPYSFTRDGHTVVVPAPNNQHAIASFGVDRSGHWEFMGGTSYVWAANVAKPRFRDAIHSSRLSYDKATFTFTGSASALAASAAFEAMYVESAKTGKLMGFPHVRTESTKAGKVQAWVYRSPEGITLRIVND